MFSSISWQQYIIFLLIALLIYYISIALLYFRTEIAGLFRRDKIRNISFSAISSSVIKEDGDNSILFPAVHELVEELKEVIRFTADKNFPKEEIGMTLKNRIVKYPQLKDTPFVTAINNFLREQLPQLEETDLKRLWQ